MLLNIPQCTCQSPLSTIVTYGPICGPKFSSDEIEKPWNKVSPEMSLDRVAYNRI